MSAMPARQAAGMPSGDVSNGRGRRLLAAYLVILSVLAVRTAFLGVVRHRRLEAVSESNRLRINVTRPTRGRIYDRAHRLLVDNRLSWSLTYTPTPNRPADATLARLALLTGHPVDTLLVRLRDRGRVPEVPVVLLRDVPFVTVARVYEHQSELSGVSVRQETRRRYPSGTFAAHLLGHMGEVTAKGLRAHRSAGHEYAPGDLVGKTGIERAEETLLRGQSGVQYVEVDARGRRTGWVDPGAGRKVVHGESLILTLDSALQEVVESAFPAGERGAVVVLDPRSGAVRALASFPSFDPSWFSGTVSSDRWQSLSQDPERPLLDRTITGVYPPASIMKLVTASAGLESGVIDIDTRLDPCELPGWRLGSRIFRCWKPHGSLTVVQAIARSCDVFFYQVGVRLGLQQLHDMAVRLGLGAATGSGLPGEDAGLVPDAAYYDRRYGRRKWLEPSQTVNLAIGQGELLVTPLQIAVVTAFFANGGSRVTPYAVEQSHPLLEEDGELLRSRAPQRVRDISEKTIRIVRAGMQQVVADPEGTARALQDLIPGLSIGAKTGTAQNPQGEVHGWFTGFAPFDDPELVVTVLVENAGGGAETALPVARAVFRDYFGLRDTDAVETEVETQRARLRR